MSVASQTVYIIIPVSDWRSDYALASYHCDPNSRPGVGMSEVQMVAK